MLFFIEKPQKKLKNLPKSDLKSRCISTFLGIFRKTKHGIMFSTTKAVADTLFHKKKTESAAAGTPFKALGYCIPGSDIPYFLLEKDGHAGG